MLISVTELLHVFVCIAWSSQFNVQNPSISFSFRQSGLIYRMAGKSQNIKLVRSKREQHFSFNIQHSLSPSWACLLWSTKKINMLCAAAEQQNKKKIMLPKKNRWERRTNRMNQQKRWVKSEYTPKKKLFFTPAVLFFGGVLRRDDNIDRRLMSLRVTSAP